MKYRIYPINRQVSVQSSEPENTAGRHNQKQTKPRQKGTCLRRHMHTAFSVISTVCRTDIH